ncbi:hypothetical protein FHR61_003894 [Xanthomonas arboricola]|uniref:Uncharacterized protein n=1 Tax=Xanthomonas cannabis TaxID=1885674 RepID=A0ABR6JS34_9XANT|nr:hypothetical protein [Xanthomonas cannabis]MBB5524004.1 hypothetical protein [Xanthomonas cannabis]
MSSPLAGHALNPSPGPCGGIHAATRSRNRQGHRTRQLAGCFFENILLGLRRAGWTFLVWSSARLAMESGERLSGRPVIQPEHVMHCLQTHTPTISTGPCPPTVAGPYAAWMPRKSLHGRIHGVSRDGGRARALQPSCRPADQGPAAKLQTSGSGPCSQVADQRIRALQPSCRSADHGPATRSQISRQGAEDLSPALPYIGGRSFVSGCWRARAQRPSRRRL